VDKTKAQEHLVQADVNLEKVRKLIARQKERLGELARDGHKTQNAERSLKNFEELEKIIESSRNIICQELDGFPKPGRFGASQKEER
jgi:hypothetical protein